MPGVIQPNRPQSSLGNVMQLGQTAMSIGKSFGSGGGSQTPDPNAQTSAGNIGDATQAAQGQAVPPPSYQMGDYTSPNVFQRRMQRSY